MDMDLSFAGLVIIAIAWLVQMAFSWRGNKEIQPAFIICYIVGVLMLVTADYLKNSTLSYFELLTCIAAGLVLLKITKAKK